MLRRKKEKTEPRTKRSRRVITRDSFGCARQNKYVYSCVHAHAPVHSVRYTLFEAAAVAAFLVYIMHG